MNIQEKVSKIYADTREQEEERVKNLKGKKKVQNEKDHTLKNWNDDEKKILTQLAEKFSPIQVSISTKKINQSI